MDASKIQFILDLLLSYRCHVKFYKKQIAYLRGIALTSIAFDNFLFFFSFGKSVLIVKLGSEVGSRIV